MPNVKPNEKAQTRIKNIYRDYCRMHKSGKKGVQIMDTLSKKYDVSGSYIRLIYCSKGNPSNYTKGKK